MLQSNQETPNALTMEPNTLVIAVDFGNTQQYCTANNIDQAQLSLVILYVYQHLIMTQV